MKVLKYFFSDTTLKSKIGYFIEQSYCELLYFINAIITDNNAQWVNPNSSNNSYQPYAFLSSKITIKQLNLLTIYFAYDSNFVISGELNVHLYNRSILTGCYFRASGGIIGSTKGIGKDTTGMPTLIMNNVFSGIVLQFGGSQYHTVYVPGKFIITYNVFDVEKPVYFMRKNISTVKYVYIEGNVGLTEMSQIRFDDEESKLQIKNLIHFGATQSYVDDAIQSAIGDAISASY